MRKSSSTPKAKSTPKSRRKNEGLEELSLGYPKATKQNIAANTAAKKKMAAQLGKPNGVKPVATKKYRRVGSSDSDFDY